MLAIRSGMGLGDSLYLQSIARHFVSRGHHVEVCSKWADVFRPLNGKVTVSPFRRNGINRLAHYSRRRHIQGTTQFQDCCIEAGIRENVDLRLDWVPINPAMVLKVRASGKPTVAVQLPRPPMDRKDQLGAELMPDCRVIQRAIDALHGRAFIVQIGSGKVLHQFERIDLDLANRTSAVSDLLDVAWACDAFLGYPSFMIPLAESLNKPALLVWSQRGLRSQQEVIRQMTPEKLLHKKSSRYVLDSNGEDASDAALALLDAARSPAKV